MEPEKAAKVAVSFARRLRSKGARCGVAETIDAARALSLIETGRSEDYYAALKITLVKSRDETALFEKLREELKKQGFMDLGSEAGSTEADGWMETGSKEYLGVFSEKNGEGGGRKRTAFSYSPSDVVSRKRLTPPKPEDIVEERRVIRRMRRRLALADGRRLERNKRGDPDIWRSLRASYSTFGEILRLIKFRRKKMRTKLVVLVDVSGSMDNYSDWLLKTIHTLCRYGRKVECFLFSTRLFRVTEILSKHSPEAAVEIIWRWADMWGSGTKIGRCFASFLERYGEMVDRNTTVIVISDGWDTGEPRLLKWSISQLRKRAGRLVWLNPYADKPGYKPLTIGMLTALAYVDIFAGISVLDDMRSFTRVFGRSLKPLRRGEKLGLPARVKPSFLRDAY